jgi:hypothetical protein
MIKVVGGIFENTCITLILFYLLIPKFLSSLKKVIKLTMEVWNSFRLFQYFVFWGVLYEPENVLTSVLARNPIMSALSKIKAKQLYARINIFWVCFDCGF